MSNPRPVGGRLISAAILFLPPCRTLYFIDCKTVGVRDWFRHRS